MLKECSELVEVTRQKNPLVHHITNYVTVNDCANITLAIGASPIMADAIGEAAEIAAISDSLVINMGTLNERTVPSMIAAGKSARAKNIPVIFDPVGAGASVMRNEAAALIMTEVKPNVLRGNISEICFIAGLKSAVRGVDASAADTENACAPVIAAELTASLNCITAITGAVDTVSDGIKTLLIHNGHKALGDITGSGCMCTSLIGSFCGASPDKLLYATAAALLTMGISGELAWKKAGKNGTSSFRTAVIDAVSTMSSATILKYGKLR